MSLQDLCIGTIVDEFESYYLAFKSGDVNLKRQLEFLQKVYSFQIASKLYDMDNIQEKYIDFLINKYLKTLDTDWFRNCQWKTVKAKFAEVGSNLEKINFNEFSGEMPWQDIISYLSNLQIMSFQDDCNNEILKCVAKFCPNIVEIDVIDSQEVTNEGIKYLCMKENGKVACPKLKKLLISASYVTDEGVKHLIKNLPSLEVIDYFGLPQVLYMLHKNDLSALDKIEPYNLIGLNLSYLTLAPYFNDVLKVCLSLCPRLKFLTCAVSSEEHLNLLSFFTLSELEKLKLECHLNSPVNVNNLLRLKGGRLTSLTLHFCSLSVSLLAKSCPRLNQLCLDQINFLDSSDSIPFFHCLESCTFENITFDLMTVKSLCSLLLSSTKLEDVAFKKCDLFSSEVKANILNCCERCPIKKITFGDSIVEMSFAQDILMNCHSLKCLNLEGCDLDIEEEEELFNLSRVVPNNPDVFFSERLSISDYEDSLNFYDFEGDLEDEFDDYMFPNYIDEYDYDYDDDDDDDDEENGFILEM